MPAFPPEILAVEVKFLCTSCQSRLGADARWQGRGVLCPVCGDKTRVPLWSNIPGWSPTPETSQGAKAPLTVKLSSEEIAFLSQPTAANPGAGL
jgi:DNA-directed RNA polymerase subunit RPC12/RpoP